MSKRVLFVIPPALGDLAAHHEASAGVGALSPAQNAFAYPPHTVAVCAAVAGEAGWTVAVRDGAGAPTGEVAAEVAQQEADVVAVLVAAGTAEADLTFLRLLRYRRRALAPRPPVLLFGPSAGLVARSWVEDGLAVALLAGEPEVAVGLALDAVNSGAGGILASGEIAPDAYTPAGLLRDIDAAPVPAWHLVPWQPYKMVSLLSSRGCPAGCRYCAYTLTQGNAWRAQSVERTVDEWIWLAEKVRPPSLVIRDPVFAHDRARVAAICESVAGKGSRLGWACESRPEHFDRELIQLMRAAGCAAIKIGMESGDGDLLARMGRIAQPEAVAAYVEQVARVSRWCEEAGVRCRIFVMAGLPGQLPPATEATVAALKRVAPAATIHANVYRANEGVALEGFNQQVAPAALRALRDANRPAAPVFARMLGFARRQLRGVSRTREVALPAATVETTELGVAPEYLLAGSRVFLTGGSGFVGGRVARALLDAGAEVVALLRPGVPPGALAGLPLRIERGDLIDPSSWSAALRGCRFCFHVAALYGGPDKAQAMYAVNGRGTGSLLAACAEANVARFVYTGTIGTVGRPADPGALPDERTPFNLWDQASHYVRSKWIGESNALAWSRAGLDVVIVKPTAPVGEGDGGRERPPSATGRRILAALRGQPFSYPAGGVNHAPVRDIAAGHLLAAERGRRGETYILGHAAGNLDRAAFLRLVAQAAGSPLPAAKHQQAPSAGPDALTADPSRAVRELGLPQSDVTAAFAEAVAWYRAEMLEAREHAVAG